MKFTHIQTEQNLKNSMGCPLVTQVRKASAAWVTLFVIIFCLNMVFIFNQQLFSWFFED